MQESLASKSVGIYRAQQPSSSPPAYFLTREQAKALKADNRGFFINHGKALRLIEEPEPEPQDLIAAGSFDQAWKIRYSGCIPVWQLQT